MANDNNVIQINGAEVTFANLYGRVDYGELMKDGTLSTSSESGLAYLITQAQKKGDVQIVVKEADKIDPYLQAGLYEIINYYKTASERVSVSVHGQPDKITSPLKQYFKE